MALPILAPLQWERGTLPSREQLSGGRRWREVGVVERQVRGKEREGLGRRWGGLVRVIT